jgi:hypothetical protein
MLVRRTVEEPICYKGACGLAPSANVGQEAETWQVAAK